MTRLVGVSVFVAATLLGACGGDGGAGGDGATDASSGGEVGGGAAEPCPLSAEQVSEALGATVEADAAGCTFFPADGSAAPSAILVRLPALACDEEAIEATGLGYEPYDGFDADAYTASGGTDRARFLVCGDSPFELSTDIPDDGAAALTAAEDLVRLVLDGA